VLSAIARSLSSLAAGLARRGSAARARPLALIGAGALAILLGAVASEQGARPGLVQPAHAAAPPRHPPVPPPALYRIAGCRSRAGAYSHGPSRREVAIGFDDGPARDTGAFLAMLERSKARATFFMIGSQVSSAYKGTLLRALRDGDALGDHSFSHPYLTQSGRVYSELDRTRRAIRSLSGYTPCVFRPPYGAYSPSVVRTAGSLGLATVLWDVDPRDWALPGSRAIRQQVLAQVRPGAIIVSHDGGGPRGETLAAYPSIIASLRARGYRIVTIPELLGFRPIYVPCVLLCQGIGIPRRELPHGAIIERAGR
jgi:peptidoglycan/xylan/chitin deacetylase (PgdA/CDA1 family)